jgi:hypothetical protein
VAKLHVRQIKLLETPSLFKRRVSRKIPAQFDKAPNLKIFLQ